MMRMDILTVEVHTVVTVRAGKVEVADAAGNPVQTEAMEKIRKEVDLMIRNRIMSGEEVENEI